ncbi:hypothetical protein SEA_EYEBALL_63 [Mycobacterium phage Eyeball]|nr:hypothetical protein SEA_EYEBALL_63 [Mycobacterium phage Eyeball]
MNPELRAVLTEALGRHEFLPASFVSGPKPSRCTCGGWSDSGPAHAFGRARYNFLEHFAEEIDKALGGLTREYAIRNHVYDDTAMLGDLDDLIGEVDLFSADHRIEERWVSGWSEA